MCAAFDHMLQKFDSSSLAYKIIANPYDALLDMANNEYDLLLIDINIPELSGHEILTTMDDFINADNDIKQSNLYRHKVPVILMSSSATLLKRNISLKHFHVQQRILKENIKNFIDQQLAHAKGNLSENTPAQ